MAHFRVLDSRRRKVRDFGFSASGQTQAVGLAQRMADKTGARHYVESYSGQERGKHLPKASPKEQREYEHIKRSELRRGVSLATAKRIAAATVRKQQARKKRKRK